EVRVRDGQRLQRLRVLGTEQGEDRLHERENRVEEWVVPAKARRTVVARHRLIERSSAGGAVAGRRCRHCGSRRANAVPTTSASRKTSGGVRYDAGIAAYRRLRYGRARSKSTSGRLAGSVCMPCCATSEALGYKQ